MDDLSLQSNVETDYLKSVERSHLQKTEQATKNLLENLI
jgi:hypothetical protein